MVSRNLLVLYAFLLSLVATGSDIRGSFLGRTFIPLGSPVYSSALQGIERVGYKAAFSYYQGESSGVVFGLGYGAGLGKYDNTSGEFQSWFSYPFLSLGYWFRTKTGNIVDTSLEVGYGDFVFSKVNQTGEVKKRAYKLDLNVKMIVPFKLSSDVKLDFFAGFGIHKNFLPDFYFDSTYYKASKFGPSVHIQTGLGFSF